MLVSDMSGRASVMMKARDLGVDVNAKDPVIGEFLDELKNLEFRGYEYEAADASFELLLSKFLKKHKDHFGVRGYRVIVERDEFARTTKSEATVKLEIDGSIEHTVAEAHGPVAALDLALRKALAKKFPKIKDIELSDFKVRIIDSGAGGKRHHKGADRIEGRQKRLGNRGSFRQYNRRFVGGSERRRGA